MSYPSFSAGDVLTASDMNAVGLWKIASGSLSLTTTATNVTGVFSSDYKQYRLLLNNTARSTSNRIDMKYIVGTTATSTNYYQGGIASDFSSNTTVYMQRSNNDSQFYGITSNSLTFITMDIANPNVAASTLHSGTCIDNNSGYGYSFGGLNQTTNQFTGFQLFTSTGTATVEYQVFGYRN